MNSLRLLRWLFLGRLTLAAGVFTGAVLVWPATVPETTLLVTMHLLLAVLVTAWGYWHTEIRYRVPGRTFLYAQILFDVLAVTLVVHVTGGGESSFPPLYILVIAAGALLLPKPGGVLIGALSSSLYIADLVWLQPTPPTAAALLQIGVFVLVALATAALADRLRQAGAELGEARLELRQLRTETADILGAMETGVVTVDGDGRLVYLNPAAESLLAMSGARWLGKPVLDELDRVTPGLGSLIRWSAETRIPVRRHETRVRPRAAEEGGDVVPATSPAPAASAAVAASGGRAAGATSLAANGAPAGTRTGAAGGPGTEERVFGIRTTVLERDGAPWVTAVFQDITDGKRVEALNRRAERLEAVAELAASLAHEIKNPLASIRSAVEQLAAGHLTPDEVALLERLVLSESDRLSRLLSEFIEFSRVELRGREPVDLLQVVRGAVGLVEQHPDAAEVGGIELRAPDSPVVLEGDADLLHRAVFNLVLNAAQHTGVGGRVRIELAAVGEDRLPIGVHLESPVRLVVEDEGPGIAPEDVPRIFDPFFTTRKGGSGLGLALVHRAVEAHQGAIFVDSAPGRGARFTVYFPARLTEPAVRGRLVS